MSDPVLRDNDPYLRFEADRAPTSTENVVASSGIIAAGYDFYWLDTSTSPKTRYDFNGGSNGSYACK